jgi:di/tricarboxylate transporter
MATPSPSSSGRSVAAMYKRLISNRPLYIVFIFALTAGAIVLMTVPALTLSDPPKESVLDLKTTFSTLSGKGWLSLAFILIGFLLMVFDLVGPDLAMNLVLLLMVTFNILSVKNALVGFSNSGLMTVVMLFIVAQAITATGGADYLVTKLLGTTTDTMLAQVRMCLVTALFSSFVNDTPVFMIMLPIVLTWASKSRLPIRQLLIPLSYCCLLGGLNTTIGTSTNLVVTGQFDSRVLDPASEYYQPGKKPIGLFGITPYGIPNVIWGIIYIVYTAPFLLTGGAGRKVFGKYARMFKKNTPDGDVTNGALIEKAFEQGSDFWLGLLVTPDSAAVGKSIQDAGLRHLEGVYLTSARHNGKIIHAVSHDFVINAGDVLYFSGVPDGIEALATKHGLVPYSDALENIDNAEVPNLQAAFGVDNLAVPRAESPASSEGGRKSAFAAAGPGAGKLELVEVTVKKNAKIAGQSIRASAFRSRFNASVVAIKRDGVPLEWKGQMGDELLKAGDNLLLDIDPQFWTTPDVNLNFEDIGRSGQTKTHNEFMLPMQISRTLAGKTVQKSGLRQLPSAFLVAIERTSTTLHAIAPDEVLREGDILWFATNAGSVKFIRNTPGLVPLAERQASKLRDTAHVERRLVQAVVGSNSPLVGRTIRDVRFREQFNAAVVAVARRGERIRSKPGDIELKGSDILLLDAGGSFANQHKQDSKYFSLVLELDNTNPPRYIHTAICVILTATAFILYATEVLDILVGAGLAVVAMLLTGCLSPDQARNAIRWDVYLMIAGSFGVSAGLEQSGGAAAIANLIVQIGRNAGGSGFIIAAIYVATTLLSQVVSNNSAAALVFPIAATISKIDGIDIYILSYAVMLGASSVFMSSFGYQTNLLAQAAGGHSARDFLKFGSPMQIVLAVVSIVSLILGDSKWPLVWAVTGIAGVVFLSLPQVVVLLAAWRNRKKF